VGRGWRAVARNERGLSKYERLFRKTYEGVGKMTVEEYRIEAMEECEEVYNSYNTN